MLQQLSILHIIIKGILNGDNPEEIEEPVADEDEIDETLAEASGCDERTAISPNNISMLN